LAEAGVNSVELEKRVFYRRLPVKRITWTVLLLLGMVLFCIFTGCKELTTGGYWVFTNHSSKEVGVEVDVYEYEGEDAVSHRSFTLRAYDGTYTLWIDEEGGITYFWTPSDVRKTSETGKIDFFDN
jgi:hypothetical protein